MVYTLESNRQRKGLTKEEKEIFKNGLGSGSFIKIEPSENAQDIIAQNHNLIIKIARMILENGDEIVLDINRTDTMRNQGEEWCSNRTEYAQVTLSSVRVSE